MCVATSIGNPASAESLNDFERRHDVKLHSGIRQLYEMCNGLVAAGDLLISIWDIGSVQPQLSGVVGSRSFIFGDILLASDDIMTDFAAATSPVIMVGADQVLATDFGDFLTQLFPQ